MALHRSLSHWHPYDQVRNLLRALWIVPFLLAVAASWAVAIAAEPNPTEDQKKIWDLVLQLGDNDFPTRERATRSLIEWHKPQFALDELRNIREKPEIASDAVQKALESDLEVKQRVDRAIYELHYKQRLTEISDASMQELQRRGQVGALDMTGGDLPTPETLSWESELETQFFGPAFRDEKPDVIKDRVEVDGNTYKFTLTFKFKQKSYDAVLTADKMDEKLRVKKVDVKPIDGTSELPPLAMAFLALISITLPVAARSFSLQQCPCRAR